MLTIETRVNGTLLERIEIVNDGTGATIATHGDEGVAHYNVRRMRYEPSQQSPTVNVVTTRVEGFPRRLGYQELVARVREALGAVKRD